jgi:hypothetical protein
MPELRNQSQSVKTVLRGQSLFRLQQISLNKIQIQRQLREIKLRESDIGKLIMSEYQKHSQGADGTRSTKRVLQLHKHRKFEASASS